MYEITPNYYQDVEETLNYFSKMILSRLHNIMARCVSALSSGIYELDFRATFDHLHAVFANHQADKQCRYNLEVRGKAQIIAPRL